MLRTSSSFVYTDRCSDISKDILLEKLGLKVIVRDDSLWDLGYIAGILTNPSVSIISLNTIDERSMAEITMAAFMCKTILVTTEAIKEYKHIYPFVTDVEVGCDLGKDNNTFVDWYNYSIGR